MRISLRGRRAGRLPEGLRIFAIGDVHGCVAELRALEAAIAERLARRPAREVMIIHLGDYIDRGLASAGVISHLAAGQARDDGIRRRYLMGNHEAMLLQVLDDPAAWPAWRAIGGLETLLSYDRGLAVAALARDHAGLVRGLRAALPEAHVRFLSSLEHLVAVGDCVFVHAGINPALPLARQQPEDLLWIRDAFLEHAGPLPRFVVHGHTPVAEPELHPYRLNIDLGVYLSGRLAGVELEGDMVEVFEAGDPADSRR